MKIISELFDLTKRYIKATIRARKIKKINRKIYKRVVKKIKARKEVVEA